MRLFGLGDEGPERRDLGVLLREDLLELGFAFSKNGFAGENVPFFILNRRFVCLDSGQTFGDVSVEVKVHASARLTASLFPRLCARG